uniref:Uncharacterized protein n=1 Tax=Chromera velia CCMP2878 TaxID=1169474 RepID=A0A0G4HX24_9ALVE|eukprot:Cvel_9142.t1-p1 / transcript=Cvel_9142.t1 / gene=Cvel_9142 / organism=Chromera_velia_CCMP2878 / gene_product=hypothetical protein / transcript_product=hypothetical protein / location=Cvel_scaffold520:31176-31640(-) / protein_length=83 / sequence_SO=supercontig / SO=protein_coding / is_pseudo=false
MRGVPIRADESKIRQKLAEAEHAEGLCLSLLKVQIPDIPDYVKTKQMTVLLTFSTYEDGVQASRLDVVFEEGEETYDVRLSLV